MAQEQTFGWNDIEQIAIALHDANPQIDPLTVRFTALRQMVEALDGFTPDPAPGGHKVNEQILEAIQVAWHEEFVDAATDADEDDDQPGYTPINPYR